LKYDLHLHTTESDGRLTPSQLVNLAKTRGLEIISVTDHDSVGGIDEAIQEAQKKHQIKVIPGVEINTDLATGELHVLGYFIDHKSSDLINSLEKIRSSRVIRAQKMVENLNHLGIDVEWNTISELASGESICRPHIALAMLKKGYVTSEREAFDKYIGRNGPAYVEREKIKPEEAVIMISKAGGLPVLAHPADIPELDIMILNLMHEGLLGIEVYYAQYNYSTIKMLANLASKYGLLMTGGTDYHHFQDGVEPQIGSVDIPANAIRQLFVRAGQDIDLG
jgi:predicted metal-dependent phosphoesterase TrpH